MTARADIAALLAQGLSNRAAARQLGIAHTTVRAARADLGLPPSLPPAVQARAVTLEEAWRAHTRPAGGGHLEWAGRVTASGAKVMRYAGRVYTAGRVAFLIRTGREPVGRVQAACDVPGCVAPQCVDDEVMRRRDRLALRAVLGWPALTDRCGRGHDQAVCGRLGPGGRPYCAECGRVRQRKRRAA